MSKDKPRAVTRSELVVETWKRLKSESLGARELEEIQKSLFTAFGESGVQSPASIAGTLADVGVRLRHPEVLDYDTVWREAHSVDVLDPGQLDFSTIEAAVASMNTIHSVWNLIKEQKNDKGLVRLRTLLGGIRDQLKLLSGSKTVSPQRKKVSLEVEQWLAVWLQNPRIFEAWLDLRMNSGEFQTVFGK